MSTFDDFFNHLRIEGHFSHSWLERYNARYIGCLFSGCSFLEELSAIRGRNFSWQSKSKLNPKPKE
ncbi:hypothetical protein [Methanobrevibacter sp.]|jgi:hypothetical protein|uniref:hypothetical protein n=1 Tax=Methanobrevibacter sp. TaxID=66852 RepID=UPI0025D1E2A1|nr:hypothetical protein [Methanobrevibacter sp.]MBQ2831071.1 hypothetical protein [Methanobrevibacter sp.]